MCIHSALLFSNTNIYTLSSHFPYSPPLPIPISHQFTHTYPKYENRRRLIPLRSGVKDDDRRSHRHREGDVHSAGHHPTLAVALPVPYLFGGLAAMLGLIAFALLILACSYWKLSGGEDGGQGDVESGAGEKGESNADAKALPVFEEKVLVIMAGDVKPTFLATPMSSRGSSSSNDEKVEGKETEKEEKINQKHQTVDENGEETSAESQVLSQHQSH
ncbi:UNVERIFIED_CONTAM: protein GLUTAMINE DUMPER 3 [Sesamum radiatum]|uniref:Protein GLUTAMINE DUMPER 3 n=1 Tax=Sesamum radiatum TaxID=300843 RepID=A0AAW2KZ20_SESRA